MTKTKIEWADMTWNPITGCRHECEYCYARGIAHRFGGHAASQTNDAYYDFGSDSYAIDFPHEKDNGTYAPFPFGFKPTFHLYRLNEPKEMAKPQNIFVCSMADLFGEWVPDEWICKVFNACEKARQHRYLFLTKNPQRFFDFPLPPDNYWYGSTITNDETTYFHSGGYNAFLSIEPIQNEFRGDGDLYGIKWVIIGAETGNRRGKVIPKREWIENIVATCRAENVPVFLKNSLAQIWGEPLIREYPWEDKLSGSETDKKHPMGAK